MSAKRSLIGRFLDFVERAGNRLPDPITLFVILAIGVIFVSALLSLIGVSATHPSDGSIIQVQSLLTKENIRRMFTDMVKNFASFPPLGLVLVTIIGIGVAERSGYINAALRKLVTSVPKSMLSATLVFGGIMSNMAADARIKAKEIPEFRAKRMHVDGLQQINCVQGFKVNLIFDEKLAGKTDLVSHRHRDLAPKPSKTT